MDKQLKISVLGAGWYGLPLAERLNAEGHQVKLSTTTDSKRDQLAEAGWDVRTLQLHGDELGAEFEPFFDADVLVVTVPPNGRREPPSAFEERLQPLQDWIEKGPIQWVIYTSSTGVYQDANGVVDEDSSKREDAPTLAAERLFAGWTGDLTVLRFGGLFGDVRQPARYFQGKQDIPNGDAPINFVHLDDCIGATLHVLEHGLRNTPFNVVCSEHPSRAAYYTHMCEQLGLPLPSFQSGKGDWKIVSNQKLLDSGYEMRVHLPENI